MTGKPVVIGIGRGLACRCPNCARGRLFARFLKVQSPCGVCGNENAEYPVDDFPPYLTILLVGHLVVPSLIWSDLRFEPALWLQAAIWLPLTLILSLALLPRMKGASAGLCWAIGLTRSGRAPPRPAHLASD